MRSTTVPGEPLVSTESSASGHATFRLQGALAGLFGATLLAAWFLYLDTLRGEPLFTPTLLATALLHGSGAQAPQTFLGSLWLTLLFTVVHALAFVAVGIGVAYLLERFALFRTRVLIILLVFGILCAGFFAVGAIISAPGPEGIAMRDALIGNAIAALAMGAYLARFLPPGQPPS